MFAAGVGETVGEGDGGVGGGGGGRFPGLFKGDLTCLFTAIDAQEYSLWGGWRYHNWFFYYIRTTVLTGEEREEVYLVLESRGLGGLVLWGETYLSVSPFSALVSSPTFSAPIVPLALQFHVAVRLRLRLDSTEGIPSSSEEPSSDEDSWPVGRDFVVKLLRRGLGDVGTQDVRRGGVGGMPTTFPGDVQAATSTSVL